MIALWWAALAGASTLEVCSGCAYERLTDAIAASAPDDVILVGDGSYAESLRITHGLVLRAKAGASPSIVGAAEDAGEPVLSVEGDGASATWVHLDGIAISAVNTRPVEVERAELNLRKAYVTSVGVLPEGGAILARDAKLYLDQCTFDGNRTTGRGGHVHAVRTAVRAFGTLFHEGRANGYGGAIFATGAGASVEVFDGRFEDNRSFSHGGAIAVDGAPLNVLGVHLEGNRGRDGGAIWAFGAAIDEPAEVIVGKSRLVGNVADNAGGALHVSLAEATVAGNDFTANVAGDAGAILANPGTILSLHANLFCANRANGLGTGAVRYTGPVVAPVEHRWANNAFIENTSSGGEGAAKANGVPELVIENNAFLGNRGGAEGAAVRVDGDQMVFRDNLLGWTHGLALAGSRVQVSHNAWWQNDRDHDAAPLVVTHSVTGDPMLRAYSRDGDCGNDSLQPSWYGALRDTGTPGQVDPDGSRRDIGSYGGLDAPPADWADFDSDGSPNLYDCERSDPDISPLAEEIWYDGVDQDCDGWSDFDQDRDGADSDQYGGDDCDDLDPGRAPHIPEIPYDGIDQDCDGVDLRDGDGDGVAGVEYGGTDCDDDDPSVYPGAPELDDHVDRDCDGFASVPAGLRPKQCATPHPAGLGLWVAGLMLVVGRRRAGRSGGS